MGGENRDRRPRLHQRLPQALGLAARGQGRPAAGGKPSASGDPKQGEKIQIEFVSANPTGPLHVGHGRGAAFGASLANVLAHAGHEVYREYYVNDAGRQMDILALSTWLRYLTLCNEFVPFPGNAYQGGYVGAMADSIFALHGERYKRAAADIRPERPTPPPIRKAIWTA
jgi:arginyl-tRNA synthetase